VGVLLLLDQANARYAQLDTFVLKLVQCPTSVLLALTVQLVQDHAHYARLDIFVYLDLKPKRSAPMVFIVRV